MRRRFSRKLLRSVAISAAAAGMTAACVFASAYLLFPLNGIEVVGASKFQRSELSAFDSRGSSLLTLNASAIEHAALEDPWVKEASVTKDWLNGVAVVEVEERRPVLLAEAGGSRAVFATDGEELPGSGSVGLRAVELERYEVEEVLAAVRVLERNGAQVESVDGYGLKGIEATVQGRAVIFSAGVGAGQARELTAVMEENPTDARFDLRSPGRIVVGGDEGESGAAFGGDPKPDVEG